MMNDPKQAVDGVDAIYTDAWASMGWEHEAAQARQNFRALSGERKAGGRRGPARGLHALPAGASRRRNHRRGHGLAARSSSTRRKTACTCRKQFCYLLLGGDMGRLKIRSANA